DQVRRLEIRRGIRLHLAAHRVDGFAVPGLHETLGAQSERQSLRQEQPVVAELEPRLLPVRHAEVPFVREHLARRAQAGKSGMTDRAGDVVGAGESRHRARLRRRQGQDEQCQAERSCSIAALHGSEYRPASPPARGWRTFAFFAHGAQNRRVPAWRKYGESRMARTGSARTLVLLAAVVVLIAAALVYAAYRHDLREARARIAGGSRIAETPCGAIEYASAGEGPPVLFVHGAGGGYDQGLGFGENLARNGFRLIAMSRFGYLRTPLPADASAAAQADAHACLLDALGIDAAAVIGGSAGAPSAVQVALRHPQRVTALVLVVPALYVPRPGTAPSVEPAPG